MRIVIDMQGAQTGSRFRGIGRYTLALAKAIVRNRGKHDVILALNGLFPDTLDALRREFDGLLSAEHIRVWSASGPVREEQPGNALRREIAEKIREAFLADLQPDVVLITSLFEGMGDDAVGSIGSLNDNIPTAVVLYDLIPLINPDEHFRASRPHQDWYHRKITSLKRSKKLLAISESARGEALDMLDISERDVVNIFGACDDAFHKLNLSDTDRQNTWNTLGIERPFVMYTGGADATKNLHRLISAYAQLPKKVRASHQLVFAGKMPEGNVLDLLNSASKNGLSTGDVIFTGYLHDDDLLKLYNTCSLFVFPSLHEGFGLPPLEAMACGAAVIGANVTSLPEVIGLKEALFDPYSVKEISSKIERALTDAKFRARLLEHGRTHFKTFSWDETARRALEALGDFDRANTSRVSPRVNLERTSLFEKRHQRILALKLDHMGDFILAIPALAKLKAKYPYAALDIVIGSWNLPIAKQLGLFDQIYTYDYFKRKSSEAPSITLEKFDALLKALPKYDVAIDLRRQSDTRFVLARTRANVKVGYETFDPEIDSRLDVAIRTYPDIPFRSTPLNQTSISRQMLKIVDAIPASPNDFLQLPALCANPTVAPGTVAIFPKAGSESREWAMQNYVELVNQLIDNPNVKQIRVYFANSNEAAEFKFEESAKLDLKLGLDFSALTQSLSSNVVCVANNSGGAHLASYLGLTVIGIYSGHELASEWAPQFNDSYTIHRGAQCAPCHGAKREDCPNELFCLTDISVDDVYGQTIEALSIRSSTANGSTQRNNRPTLAIRRSTSSIMQELTDAIAPLIARANDIDLVALSVGIANNHPQYEPAPSVTCVYPGKLVDHRSMLIEWIGFSGVETQFRWTDGNSASMSFECPETIASAGTVTVIVDTLGPQRVVAHINNSPAFDEVKEGGHIELKLRADTLRIGTNTVTFSLPDAREPGNGDRRKLALAVRGFCLTTPATDTVAV
jgi:glycosyltransferase involved in cell wall biosynthesis/ADP-heptose:LPS heptosyltransferase